MPQNQLFTMAMVVAFRKGRGLVMETAHGPLVRSGKTPRVGCADACARERSDWGRCS